MCFDFPHFGGFDLVDPKDKPTERAWLNSKNHTFLLHPKVHGVFTLATYRKYAGAENYVRRKVPDFSEWLRK